MAESPLSTLKFRDAMAAKFQDYYETLGVARTVTAEEIRKAHRKLSRQHHPDSRFAIEGTDDLLTGLPVAPWEAVLDAKVPLAMLDGSVEMTVPSGSPTGQRLRLRGQGLSRRDSSRGDLSLQRTFAEFRRVV